MSTSCILPTPRPLSGVATMVDENLAVIDREIDWLFYLSPLDNEHIWQRFVETGFSEEPILRYAPLRANFHELHSRLLALPITAVEHPLLRALFAEKQKECELFLLLVQERESEGVLALSLELFGGTEAHLVDRAKSILSQVPSAPTAVEADWVGWEEFAEEAERILTAIRERFWESTSTVVVDDDLNSHLMVHRGNLHIARSVRVPRARLAPLLAHEIGTHVITHINGSRQGLRLLEVGLSGYDETQEGLGVLAEYLAGYLPPNRLRVLAARVLAAEMVAHRATIVEMFHALSGEWALPAEDAFDVAVRARRGGGLTKDAIYLRGIEELLAHLRRGGALMPLYRGKFALTQLPLLEQLEEQDFVIPPTILPDFMLAPDAQQRLHRARDKTIETFFQLEPEPS